MLTPRYLMDDTHCNLTLPKNILLQSQVCKITYPYTERFTRNKRQWKSKPSITHSWSICCTPVTDGPSKIMPSTYRRLPINMESMQRPFCSWYKCAGNTSVNEVDELGWKLTLPCCLPQEITKKSKWQKTHLTFSTSFTANSH
jgi:hypothetical protein